MQKDFDQWNGLKKKLDLKIKLSTFNQREIWWCNIGINIGNEENGKSEYFSRPVLVLKKFNSRIFFGIPLTTQIKEKSYYHKIVFDEKEQCLMLSQLRIFDSKRLTKQIGKMSPDHFSKVKEAIKDMI